MLTEARTLGEAMHAKASLATKQGSLLAMSTTASRGRLLRHVSRHDLMGNDIADAASCTECVCVLAVVLGGGCRNGADQI